MSKTAKEMKKDLIELGIRPHIVDGLMEMVVTRSENTGESLEEAGAHIAKYLASNSQTVH